MGFEGNYQSIKRIRDKKVSFWRWLIWGDFQCQVTEGFTFSLYDENGLKYTVEIPAGYIFDGGSIPRFFWRFVKPDHKPFLPGYAIHDYMLEHLDFYNEQVADLGFLHALRWLGADEALAQAMYLSVSLWESE